METHYPADLADAQWACLRRHLPLATALRQRRHSLRRVFDAIFYLLRTGCQWRGCPLGGMPADYPPWQTVYYHFRRFRLDGLWGGILAALRQVERRRVGKQPQPSAAIMDAQSVKTVEESARISGYDGHKRVRGRNAGALWAASSWTHWGSRSRSSSPLPTRTTRSAPGDCSPG
jgi:putative transposase